MKDNKDFALSLTAGSGLLGGLGEYQQGQGDADVARYNATIARRQAKDALARAGFAVDQINRAKGHVEAQQRTAFASQGVALNEGTPVAAAEDVERAATMDVLTVQNNAALEALGFREAAAGYKYESRLAKRKGTYGALGKFSGGAADAYAISAKLGD